MNQRNAMHLVLLLPLALAVPVSAGDKPKNEDKPAEFTVKGQIVLPRHKIKMEKDRTYILEVKTSTFMPRITIVGVELPFGSFDPPFAIIGQPAFKAAPTNLLFTPKETKEHEVIVSPLALGLGNAPDSKLDYTLTVRLLPKPILQVADKWTEKDPQYSVRNTYFKAYPVKMKAGATYVIDLIRAGNDFKLDPYLFLEDANKKVVAEDDDSGGNLNARIVFSPHADGEFRIIATTLSPATGDFTLTVRGPALEKK